MIESVDVDRNHRRVISRGQMNGTKHQTVLQVLTQCAQQFHRRLGGPGHKDSDHTWAIEGTGMLETLGLGKGESEIEQPESSKVNKITVPEKVLQVHGFAPPRKAEGTVRLIYDCVGMERWRGPGRFTTN